MVPPRRRTLTTGLPAHCIWLVAGLAVVIVALGWATPGAPRETGSRELHDPAADRGEPAPIAGRERGAPRGAVRYLRTRRGACRGGVDAYVHPPRRRVRADAAAPLSSLADRRVQLQGTSESLARKKSSASPRLRATRSR